jgi:hypothetical protein
VSGYFVSKNEADATTEDLGEPLRLLVAWLRETGEAASIGEGLDLFRDARPLPDDVQHAWARIRSTLLNDLFRATLVPPISAAIDALAGAFYDERDAQVFWTRISPPYPTLDELAVVLDVTRQRVRQLQMRAEAAVDDALKTDACTAIRWRVWRFGLRLGRAAPRQSDLVQGAIADLIVGIPEGWRDRVTALAMWRAGPYREEASGWLYRGQVLSRNDLISTLDVNAPIDLDRIRAQLGQAGLVPEAQDVWISDNLSLRTLKGRVYWWRGSVMDKAAIVLSANGVPATPSAIAEAVGEGHDARATRMRLLGDPRFMRVDRFRIGLRAWGFDEYTGMADEITEELERRGGEADLGEVISAVAMTFSASVASISMFAGAPRFVVAQGRIRFRRSDEPYEIRQPLTDEARCYMVSEDVYLVRVDVNEDVLRGSGRRIPESLGAWLGVLPGDRRLYAWDDATHLQVSWPDSALQGPTLGSLRGRAARLGAASGDHLLLTFNRATAKVSANVVRSSALANAHPRERLALLTGLGVADALLEERLAKAVGANGKAELRARLRRRNEELLIEMLQQDGGSDFDAAIDRLRSIL